MRFSTPESMARMDTLVGQMQREIKTYAPDRADAINKKVAELSGNIAQAPMEWQKYQTAAMTEPIDTALESVERAPESMRESLYQQVVNRVAATGDVSIYRQRIQEMAASSTSTTATAKPVAVRKSEIK